jgi:phosphatidylglycerol:prolipoprotein diacylglycerol transferase
MFRVRLTRIVPRGAEGGAVAYGALLSVPASLPVLAAFGLPFATFWDAGSFGFLAAIIFLRIGCLLNGCCRGRATQSRFGWVARDASGVIARRVPVPFWEAAWAATLLVGAILVVGRMPFPGSLFASTLGAYAAGRFFLDFARDAPRHHAGLTVAQWLSAVLALLSLVSMAVGWWMTA